MSLKIDYLQLGQIHLVRIECQSYLPDWRPTRPYQESYSAKKDEGGVLRDLIHEVDYATWLFGWPTAVQARLRNLGRLGIDAEETAELFWEGDNGCLISMNLDYLSRPARRKMQAMGEHGTLTWDGIAKTVRLALVGEKEQCFHFDQTVDEMYLAQDIAFLNVDDNDALDIRLATGPDGIKALALCDAARLASKTRREEQVSYL